MKRKIFLLVYSICSIFFCEKVYSQANNIEIDVKGKASNILIRWYPGNAAVFQSGLTNGYKIERKTVKINVLHKVIHYIPPFLRL
jgi:hypothetical protein